jgi:hypothetical protein
MVSKIQYFSSLSSLSIRHCLSKNTSKRKKIVVWPYMASSHNAKDTLARLEELKIEYLPKEESPPNVSQLQSIKIFFVCLKGRSTATTIVQKLQKKRAETTKICKVMKEVPTKVLKAHKFGVTSFFCKYSHMCIV